MGCNNTKITVIPELTSPVTIDQLPVEIIYKILDELDICTIFVSLYNVCKRFDKIISTYHEYHLNLKTISLINFDLICSRIHPEQITELTLSDDENSPGLVELFLSKFSLNKFIRLRSLTLIQINNEEFINQILIPIADQTSLCNFSSIKIINNDETYDDIFVEVIMSTLIKPSLRKVYFDLSYSRTTSNPLPWLEQSSIRHMTFRGTCTVNFLRNTFTHTPQLQSFNIDDIDFDDEIDLNNVQNNQNDDDNNNSSSSSSSSDEDEFEVEENVNNNYNENPLLKQEKFASIESTNHLTSLTLNTCTISMSKLEWILQEISTLRRLRLITLNTYDDELILDGHRWENLLLNINKFEFIFNVNISDSSLWNIDTCITTFRTSFWIEEKQWFVSLEKYDNEVILYTLPYLNKFYVIKTELSSFDYRSTAFENSSLQNYSMNNIHDLYIDVSNGIKCQIKNISFPRFSHVKHLFLYGKWPKSKSFLIDIRTIVNLKSIEELNREEYIPTIDFIALLELMPNLQSIKTTTNLLDALNAAKFRYTKCLHSFIVDPNNYGDQRTVNIEPFCDMFPRIQHLTIPVDNIDSCQYILDQLKQDLISIIFRIPPNDSIYDDNDIDDENVNIDLFSEWIRELPEQYRCHKKSQQIYIYLK